MRRSRMGWGCLQRTRGCLQRMLTEDAYRGCLQSAKWHTQLLTRNTEYIDKLLCVIVTRQPILSSDILWCSFNVTRPIMWIVVKCFNHLWFKLLQGSTCDLIILVILRIFTLDARGLLARQRRGASERVVLVGESFFLAAWRLAFAAPPLNSIAPNEKKTSGTQGNGLLSLLSNGFYGFVLLRFLLN